MKCFIEIVHPVPAAGPGIRPNQGSIRIRILVRVRVYGFVHQINQLAFQDRPGGRNFVMDGGGDFLHAGFSRRWIRIVEIKQIIFYNKVDK